MRPEAGGVANWVTICVGGGVRVGSGGGGGGGGGLSVVDGRVWVWRPNRIEVAWHHL